MLVDSHCHLDHSKMEVTPEEAVRRARLAGVERIVTICTRLDRYELVRDIAVQFDDVYMGVGVHPHEAGEAGIDSPDPLIELARATLNPAPSYVTLELPELLVLKFPSLSNPALLYMVPVSL